MAVVSLPECKLPCAFVSETPLFSITSISPQPGQPTLVMLVPRNQSAGQKPVPAGKRPPPSNRPDFHLASPRVFLPAQGKLCPPNDSFRGTNGNNPPAVKAFVAP